MSVRTDSSYLSLLHECPGDLIYYCTTFSSLFDMLYCYSFSSGRALDRLVECCARHPAGQGSNPHGGEFLVGGGAVCNARCKKIPSLVPCPKHSWGPAFLTGNGPLCMGGTGVRGFSRLVWEGLLLSVMPWGRSPPAGLVFFLASQVALFSRVFLHRYLKIKELLWDAVSYFFLDILEWIDL